MPNAYSYDLRQKVLAALDGGMRKKRTSQVFGLSRNTIDLWLKRQQETGDVRPKARVGQGPEPKIADLTEFRRFAAQHADQTQAEMAKLWPGQVSASTIGRALRKINFTRKKNLRLSGER